MQDNNAIDSISEKEEVTLSLPIKKKELGEFISGLLGQQQSIERNINAKFDIDHSWLVNLHELISQRIHQQADAHLTNFTSVIYFENGLKRTFTSFEAFKCYSETKKLIPVGVKIIWNYLIQFPAKNYPEKQQITFSAQIQSKDKQNGYSKEVSEYLNSIFNHSERSSLNYQIDNTERTWGDDIEVIISNQVDGIIIGNQTVDTLFNLSRLALAVIILLFSMIYPLYSSITGGNEVMDREMSNYLTLSKHTEVTIDGVNRKLDQIANMVEIGSKPKDGSWKLLIMFLGSPISLLFLRLTRKTSFSFLVFSKESEKYRESKQKQGRQSTWVLIGSFVISVLAGIMVTLG